MNSDSVDLIDNSSIKSETLSTSSNQIEQKMTISEQKSELNSEFNSLASLLTSNVLEQQKSDENLNTTDLQMLIDQVKTGQTEQPLDLSLSSKKNFNLNDIALLSSFYDNETSLAGKIKK